MEYKSEFLKIIKCYFFFLKNYRDVTFIKTQDHTMILLQNNISISALQKEYDGESINLF